MKKYLLLINDFAHDLFTGLWICSLLVLYIVQSKLKIEAISQTVEFAHDLLQTFFWLQTWSMIFIIITGFGRYLHTKDIAKSENDPARRKLLIIKHIILGVLFIWGSFLSYLWKS